MGNTKTEASFGEVTPRYIAANGLFPIPGLEKSNMVRRLLLVALSAWLAAGCQRFGKSAVEADRALTRAEAGAAGR